MTDEQAARLRALAEAATPGPWDVRVAYDADNGVVDPNTYVAPGYYDNIGIYSASADKWPAACDEYNIFERNDAAYIAAASPDVLLHLLAALDEARRERDEAKRVIDDAYAALGGDAWWMDPPDGGSPTLAEMVAKANEDGRALYDVKRERDAAVALIAAHNAECERLCHRDVKGGRCEAYVSRGRECTDCPRDWMIDARALLGDGEG